MSLNVSLLTCKLHGSNDVIFKTITYFCLMLFNQLRIYYEMLITLNEHDALYSTTLLKIFCLKQKSISYVKPSIRRNVISIFKIYKLQLDSLSKSAALYISSICKNFFNVVKRSRKKQILIHAIYISDRFRMNKIYT